MFRINSIYPENPNIFLLSKLEVARKYMDYHTKEFGYKEPNVSFVQGYIEALSAAGLGKNSFDIIM